MKFSVPGLAAGVATAAAIPAVADAATVAVRPSAPCYVSRASVGMTASGYTPSGRVTVKLGSQLLGSTAADALGNVTGVVLRFGIFHGVHTQKLSVTDQTNPALVGSKSLRTSGIFVRVRPAGGAAGIVRHINAGGFITGAKLYAHQVRGHSVRTFGVGKLHGPCHGLDTHVRVTSRHAASGDYTVQFDTNRRYSSRATIRARFRLHVFRGAADTGSGAVAAAHRGRLLTSWTYLG